MKKLVAAIVGVLLSGCAGMGYVQDVPMEFTYDFQVPKASKQELLNRARNHFAASYGDSREVFRLEDQEQGLMVGRGIAPWTMLITPCATAYTIRFAAKEGKARVQYQLQEGVPPGSKCTGWPLPDAGGYNQIVEHLNSAAESLKTALNGSGEADKFMNF